MGFRLAKSKIQLVTLRSKGYATWAPGPFRTKPLSPPTAIAPRIPTSRLVAEENVPGYRPQDFYPVRLFDVFGDRYQVLAKVGWGTHSTTWLAQDLHQWCWLPRRYVALKINANSRVDRYMAEKELQILRHISKANRKHVGLQSIRALIDSFNIQGPHGTHSCFVFSPLREHLSAFRGRFEGEVCPPDVLKEISKMVLQGLSYLHDSCNVVHGDLNSFNILISLSDDSAPNELVRQMFEYPLSEKVLEDRTVYPAVTRFGPQTTRPERPVIIDFQTAVQGRGPHYDLIQRPHYRAPEVILGTGWTYSADVWNFGAMLCHLLEGETPFRRNSAWKPEEHLARIIALVGPPPADFLSRGTNTTRYFDHRGTFKYRKLIPKNLSLVSSIKRLDGQEKLEFLDFIKRTLHWKPEARSSAKDLLSHPWLKRKLW